MIFETIELITKELLDIETLQSRVNNGEFDDILISHPFLIMTNKGLCLVQRDVDGTNIQINAVIDSSKFVTIDMLEQYVKMNTLESYAKFTDLPTLGFEDDGTLTVTIGDVTNRYAPITSI